MEYIWWYVIHIFGRWPSKKYRSPVGRFWNLKYYLPFVLYGYLDYGFVPYPFPICRIKRSNTTTNRSWFHYSFRYIAILRQQRSSNAYIKIHVQRMHTIFNRLNVVRMISKFVPWYLINHPLTTSWFCL